jgi:hypothetical protein
MVFLLEQARVFYCYRGLIGKCLRNGGMLKIEKTWCSTVQI